MLVDAPTADAVDVVVVGAGGETNPLVSSNSSGRECCGPGIERVTMILEVIGFAVSSSL